MTSKRAVGVVFIHGLAKKPSPSKLEQIWLWGLGVDNPRPDVFPSPNPGVPLSDEGVPFRLTYYADVFYGTDYETDLESYYEGGPDAGPPAGLRVAEPGRPATTGAPGRETDFLEAFEAQMRVGAVLKHPRDASQAPPPAATAPGHPSEYEIAAWLPESVKETIIKKAAMEAYYFLFNKPYTRRDGVTFQVRDELRRRLLADLTALAEQASSLVVVSHSMGTMLAYDVLRNCDTCPRVDTLITLGSPLGITEVQDELRPSGAMQVDFPASRLGRWVNVYDPLDPVCGADPQLNNDYVPVDGRSVEDVKESNWGSWRHTITHYLAGSRLRQHLRDAVRLGA